MTHSTQSLQELLVSIDETKEYLSAHYLSPHLQQSIDDEFKVDYTYNSNAIEGNTLTLEETRVVLEGITIGGKSIREHLEVINHKEAIEYIQELVRQDTPLSENLICNIHSIILQGINKQEAGKYRNVLVRVGGFTPPQPYMLKPQMEQFISQYCSLNIHPILKASYAHLEFVRIHPFIDGNGRTARLLMNLELLKNSYCAINIKFDKRAQYYECIKEYSNNNNGTQAFDNLIATYVYETLQKQKELVLQEKYNAKNTNTQKARKNQKAIDNFIKADNEIQCKK
ncbi:Fic family protein [Helicobacter himalayensis]|uniref:Fic family protein n=1 Tax=Helicobacter himalayensis TaxID=1591088 RepID=UPI003D6E2B02